MVAVGNNYRSQAELRKKPRRSIPLWGRILTSKKGQPRPCSIEDISETGARIVLQKDENLPKRFLLLLTSRGDARVCREVWRNEPTIGGEFIENDGL
jgi:hypothetical protein